MARLSMIVAAASLLAVLTPGLAVAASPAVAATRAQPEILPEDYIIGSWPLYQSRFVSPEGRVIDDDNQSISHSEGQGYGMLIAVAAGDRQGFERIWDWTDRELFVRDDALAAWKWEPAAEPRVTDRNDATDGDLLIAWALLRASERWKEPDWRARARLIVDAVVAQALVDGPNGKMLLPAAQGFAKGEQPDGPVVNLSYWIFPALLELETISPSLEEARLLKSGLRLAKAARFGEAELPTDWISLAAETPAPAAAFAPTFGYNAIRVPLYLAWLGRDENRLLRPYLDRWQAANPPTPDVADVTVGLSINRLSDPGYLAISDLVACSLGKGHVSEATKRFVPTTYYPSTLHLLSLMALAERYPQCL